MFPPVGSCCVPLRGIIPVVSLSSLFQDLGTGKKKTGQVETSFLYQRSLYDVQSSLNLF